MLFKEAIADALNNCKFQSGYDDCDTDFGKALREIIVPIAQQYHFSDISILPGYCRSDKKLALNVSYYNEDAHVATYVGKVLYFDIKRTKEQSDDNWYGTCNKYKVCKARTHDGAYDDVEVEEFFKNIETEHPTILKAYETHEHIMSVVTENAKLIEDTSAVASQLMAIDPKDRSIILQHIKNNTGIYISCY